MAPNRKTHVLSTWDAFGNAVHMTQQTWDCKKDRHPEIAEFFPDGIATTIREPEGYRRSTADYAKDDTIAFERKIASTETILRVLVQYESTNFLDGKTSGKITTVYPPLSGSVGQLGPLIPIEKKEREGTS